MNQDAHSGIARKLGVWIGEIKRELKRCAPVANCDGGAVVDVGTFVLQTPVEDVMEPVDLGADEYKENADSNMQAKQDQAVASADARRLVRVLEDIIRLQDEIDRMRDGLDAESSSALEHVAFRLEEVLDRSGAISIQDDSIFDIRRHRPEPMAVVKDGTLILETLKPGWREGDRVLRRALVKVRTK